MAVSAFPAAQATAARARGAPVDPRKKFVEIPRDPMSENVYRLIPGEYNPPRKEKRYISQFATQTRNEYVAGVKPAASMGPAKVPLCPPKEYLKKRAAVLAKPTGN